VIRTTIGRLNIDLRQLNHDATWYYIYDSDSEIRGELQLAASFRDAKSVASSLPSSSGSTPAVAPVEIKHETKIHDNAIKPMTDNNDQKVAIVAPPPVTSVTTPPPSTVKVYTADGPYISPPRNDGKAQPSGRFHLSAHHGAFQLGVVEGKVVASKFKTQAYVVSPSLNYDDEASHYNIFVSPRMHAW
jgi:hypothetical protein